MSDLRKSQGPLTHRFSPPSEEDLPIVTEIIEVDGRPMTPDLFDEHDPRKVGYDDFVYVLHFADWGSVARALLAVGDHAKPDTDAIVRITRKSDGKVLHILHVNAVPTTTEPIKALLRYSWKDIDFKYDGLTDEEKKLITPEQFEALAAWATTR